MTEYKKPKVYHNWMPAHQAVWDDLEENLAGTGATKVRLNQSALADRTGYCRKTVQRALEEFERCNLLNKVQSATGRGRHPTYRLNWTFYLKCASPSHSPIRHIALLRKGTSQWRYVAMKFREMVETATEGAENVSVIVGKCLAMIANRHIEFARSMYRYVRKFLQRESATWQFYQWLRGHFIPLHRGEMTMHLDELRHQRHMREKAEAKQSWQETDMPMASQFDTFREYLDAFRKWEREQGSKPG